MSENLSSEEIEALILHNQKIVEERGEGFEVDRDILGKLFDRVNNFDNISDRKERIITKSANILARITFDQPFYEGNKETALSITRLFLRRNGFDLPVDTTQRKLEVYMMLEKTISKFPGDRSIVSEVREFLAVRIIESVT